MGLMGNLSELENALRGFSVFFALSPASSRLVFIYLEAPPLSPLASGHLLDSHRQWLTSRGDEARERELFQFRSKPLSLLLGNPRVSSLAWDFQPTLVLSVSRARVW